jgi:hypothetical protein
VLLALTRIKAWPTRRKQRWIFSGTVVVMGGVLVKPGAKVKPPDRLRATGNGSR